MSIKIVVNGKEVKLDGEATVAGLLKQKDVRPEVVTVELNDSIVERSAYPDTVLKDGDAVEMVFFMGGGAGDTKRDRKSGTKAADSILDLIYNTPIVRLNRLAGEGSAEVYAKLESYSPGGSVKDRIALNMIEEAEKAGLIKKGGVIVEPTSGNTGIGLAMIACIKGYKCILTMPDSMTLERIYILKSFGAELILTPAEKGMQGAVEKAEAIAKKTKNSYMPQQFKNASNPAVHKRTTAKEIIEALPGTIDAFVCCVGTGGTITGVGEVFKKKYKNIKIIAVEPSSSAVLSGDPAGPHKIQGIGAGFIPDVLDRKVIDDIITVKDNDAYAMSQKMASQEGIFCGISSGAAIFAALKVADKLGKNKKVVTVLPDTGERYFSMKQYFDI